MKSTAGRMLVLFMKNCIRILSLLFAVSVISFVLVSASPIDPIQQYMMGIGPVSEEQRTEIATYWGVDKPPAARYISWLCALCSGNFGTSLLYRRPVIEIIAERFQNSLALMLCAWLFSGMIGFLLGVLICLRCGELTPALEKKMPFANLQEAFDVVLGQAQDGDAFCQYVIGNCYFWWDFLTIQNKDKADFPSQQAFKAYLKENISKCEDWYV